MIARCLWTEITGITKLRLAEASGPAYPQLRRVLGFRDLVLLMIGTVIGLGIFPVSGAVPRPAAIPCHSQLRYGSRAACCRHCPLGGSSRFDLAAPYGVCGMKKSETYETEQTCCVETYED
jgi:hypothetical protein